MSARGSTEGWMTEKPTAIRRYHYVRDGMALCRGYGFYAGELATDDGSSERSPEDCAACFRALRREKP